jgi:hypothetical protein
MSSLSVSPQVVAGVANVAAGVTLVALPRACG